MNFRALPLIGQRVRRRIAAPGQRGYYFPVPTLMRKIIDVRTRQTVAYVSVGAVDEILDALNRVSI